ncbi:MAG TPA: peptidylprolyl isomerase [Elusimicrobiota bacterium]|nr:peptidylprolyl isomerase [Elusimicrobiota bacterium]
MRLFPLAAACAAAFLASAAFAAAPTADERDMNAGLAALNQKKFGAAADDFTRILKRTPTHYGATFQLARALEGAGRKKQAHEQWEKALRMALTIPDWDTAVLCMERMPDDYPGVRVTTSLGAFTLRLDRRRAPATVANFLAYAREGYFDGTAFNRIFPGSFVQGGGTTPDGKPKPHARPPIKLESGNGLKNIRGTIAMARMAGPDTAEVQWFVNTANNAWMDYASAAQPGYAVFGYVAGGMGVLDRIGSVPLAGEAPKTPVVIESIRLLP